jgi:arginine deiminase
VGDERTLFIGVGNRTDPRVGPLLAKRLGMDVVTVQTRKVEALKWGRPNEIRSRLLHLDTYFTHVGAKRALALPWLLEQEHAGRDVLTRYLKGLMRYEASVEDDDVAGAVEFLKDFGRVRRFRAGTGEEDKTLGEMKLVDYVRRRGYEVHFVGGTPPAKPEFGYLFEVVLAEHARQAANVVATAPNAVIAYDGSARTIEALRRGGVQVSSFPGRELWIGNGGPHCLTLPLERG